MAEAVAEALISPLPDWHQYDEFISEIKSTTDFEKRAQMLHKAEDMLMETGAILPIYYYNDLYMQSEKVDGIYSSVFGTKYFMYATKEGDNTLKINLASEPDHLDPALNSSVDGACLAANSFSGLYTYDAFGDLVPELAEGYEVSDDGLTYTFTLKEGLKWSDGSDLTANDFVYAWKRASDPQTAADYSYMFDVIAGWDEVQLGMDALQVKAPDAKTLVVTLKSPCAYMLDLMAFPTFFPVKQSVVEAAADWQTNPGSWAQEAGFVSNGAYTLESWNHDESMVYVKNPYWYNADEVSIERIEYMLSADDTAIYAAYRAGDLDFADTVPTDEIAKLKDVDPEFHIIDNLGTYYVIFNVKSPLFEGKTVEQANAMRKAFSMLIDRQYIIDTVAQCEQEIATSFIPAGMADGNGGIFKDADNWNYPVDDGYYSTEVDVDGARKLLELAGFKFDENGKLSAETPLSFEYLTNTSSAHEAIAECIQQDLAEVGIEMTIRSIDWNVFLNERKEGNYDIARNGWLADFNDPINMLEMWTTDSGNNDAQFGRYVTASDVVAAAVVDAVVEETAAGVEEAVTGAVIDGAVTGAVVDAVTDDALAAAVVADAVVEEDITEAVVDAAVEGAVEDAVVEAVYSPLPDWTQYDEFIKEIKSTTDFEKRAEMLHQAEDMLMETGAILPIYYYNDLYMQSEKVDGIYSSVFGTKYFM